MTSEESDEVPKFRGDIDQYPLLLPIHEHNPERRFVLVSNGSDDGNSEDDEHGEPKNKLPKEGKPEYEANTGRKYAETTPQPNPSLHAKGSSSTPGLARRKSRQELPQIDTDLGKPAEGGGVGRNRSRSNVTINQQRPEDAANRREGSRESNDGLLSPAIKHTTKGRDRAYWDLNGSSIHNSADRGSAQPRGDGRAPSSDERQSSQSSRGQPPQHKRNPSGAEPPKYQRHMSEQSRYEEVAYSNGRRRESSPHSLHRKPSVTQRDGRGKKSTSPPYPQPTNKDSVPGRSPSYRRKARSPVRGEAGYSSDELARGAGPSRSRRSTVGQEGRQDSRASLLSPDLPRTPAGPRPRSKATTPVASPRVSQPDYFPDTEPPRSPRSATFPTDHPGRRHDDDRSVSPFDPADESPPRSPLRNRPRGDDGDRTTRPRTTSTASSFVPVALAMAVPLNIGDASPVERRRPPMPAHGSHRYVPPGESPPRGGWQPAAFNPAEYRACLNEPIQSYRRHSEDVQRGLIPKLPECRRRTPQTGHDDWLTMARTDNFDICPGCYDSVFALTDFKYDFTPAPARPLDRLVRCDFGSSVWYYIAFLLTMKRGYGDLRLLKNVAAASARYAPCAGARNDTRMWYSIVDPHARRPVPSFRACHGCARTVECLFPSLAGTFVPADSSAEPSRGVCSLHYLTGRRRFDDYVDIFESTFDRALARQSPPDLQLLADKIREKSLDDECMRNLPVANQKWHVMAEIPHFTVCPECFDNIVWPMIEGQPNAVARNFLTQKQRKPVGSCHLYSERMRDIFAVACRQNDIEFLVDKVNKRTRVLQDIMARNEVLSKKDPADPRIKEEIADMYRELKLWE